MSFDTNEFYLKNSDEMLDSFKAWPGSVETTVEIAERCAVKIQLGEMLIPSFATPSGKSERDYLRELAEDGLRRCYGDPIPTEARDRLEMELAVIDSMGFNAYFLIVWDFVKYAKDSGIAVGPGRGSAAGSIVSYALDITEIDPLKYNLLFERFLNAERVSMPDIDIDFSVHGREQVIRYVSEKYGKESVARIITFGRMFPRAAVRDAARVLGFEYAVGDRLSKMIPEPIMGRSLSFDDVLKKGQPLFEAYQNDPQATQAIDVARGLENIARNSSIHAAAVVIADRPLTEIVPLQLAEDKSLSAVGTERAYKTVTQYSMNPIEEIGLLKMDFLGLRNLDVIEAALDIIERSVGERPDMANLPLDDAKTYEMLSRGESIGVFQFESDGMREALRKVKPTEFEDLIALVALYRPGAMKYIDTYARGKRNPDAVAYIDQRLRAVTETTYGVVVYQEQNMQIAKEIGGFSGPQADDLRKAIGKKNHKLMASMKEKFFEGCAENNTELKVAKELWKMNEAAADYSFNKSHAACYALIAYRTAWLKSNYMAEYMAALISSVMNTKDKVPFLVSRCEDMGIKVLPPDVNLSHHGFVVVGGDIRFGLNALKGVGSVAVDAIIAAREEKLFDSIWDFCERVDCRPVNKKAIEALIKCGAFGTTGATRKGLLAVMEAAQASGQKLQQDASMGQGSIFDSFEAGGGTASHQEVVQRPPIPAEEFDQSEMLIYEKESLGMYLSSHPLKRYRGLLHQRADCSIAALANKPDGSTVTVGGMIVESKKLRTKKGDMMMFATLDDLEGQVEIIIFSNAYEAAAEHVTNDSVLIVRGRLDQKDAGDIKLVVQDVQPLEATDAELAASANGDLPVGPPVRMQIDPDRWGGTIDELLEQIAQPIDNYPGRAPIEIEVRRNGADSAARLECGPEYTVTRSAALVAALEALPGVQIT